MSKPRITSDPAVMLGKPCIAGTRITVELILRKLGAGRTIEDLLDAYPNIKRPDILAALDYAAGVPAIGQPMIAAEQHAHSRGRECLSSCHRVPDRGRV